MKHYLITILLGTHLFASFDNIVSFKADFSQTITDEKNTTIVYKGDINALKPQNVRWSYTTPIKKYVFMDNFEVTVVEPEIEQVIIRKLDSNFSFFNMITNARKISENTFITNYGDTKFTIIKNNDLIESISYMDEFENRIKIEFKNQIQNGHIDKAIFRPSYPLDFDIIRD